MRRGQCPHRPVHRNLQVIRRGGALPRPSRSCTVPSRQGTRARPTKMLRVPRRADRAVRPCKMPCRAAPMCAAAQRTPRKPRHCERVADVTGVAIHNTLRCAVPTAAPFLSAAKEREERTPSKPRFCNPSAAEVPSASVLPTPRIGICKIRAVLSYGLCVSIRDALGACAGLAGWGETSASIVRRREGTPPYESHESLCKFSSGRR